MTLRTLVDHKLLNVVARVSVGGIFLVAGVIKLFEPIEDFIAIGRSWNIVPDPLLTWYMTALPWVEVVFGLAILVGVFTRVSAVITSLTLLSFLIGIVVNMMRGRTLGECGCFGGAFEFGDSFEQLLVRDLVLMAFSLVLVFSRQTWLTIDRWLNNDVDKTT